MESDTEEMTSSYIAPRNEVEQKLVEIWAEVLQLDASEISADANFMNLGGHSLSVTKLASKIHKEFSVRIYIDKIFVCTSISGKRM